MIFSLLVNIVESANRTIFSCGTFKNQIPLKGTYSWTLSGTDVAFFLTSALEAFAFQVLNIRALIATLKMIHKLFHNNLKDKRVFPNPNNKTFKVCL